MKLTLPKVGCTMKLCTCCKSTTVTEISDRIYGKFNDYLSQDYSIHSYMLPMSYMKNILDIISKHFKVIQ